MNLNIMYILQSKTLSRIKNITHEMLHVTVKIVVPIVIFFFLVFLKDFRVKQQKQIVPLDINELKQNPERFG